MPGNVLKLKREVVEEEEEEGAASATAVIGWVEINIENSIKYK